MATVTKRKITKPAAKPDSNGKAAGGRMCYYFGAREPMAAAIRSSFSAEKGPIWPK